MGTLLQEAGHDAVIIGFINQILKSEYPHAFYVVTPALGPKRDIYFLDQSTDRYQSAWSVSHGNYIPEFEYRGSPVNQQWYSRTYLREVWYQSLSTILGHDLKTFIERKCREIEGLLHSDLPDIVGFSHNGNPLHFAEVKFEGLTKGAQQAVLRERKIAEKLSLPYYLILPRQPIYARPLTHEKIKSLFQDKASLTVFTFSEIETIVPKQKNLQFSRIPL